MKCELCEGKYIDIEYGRAVLRVLPFDLPTLKIYIKDSLARAEMTVNYCPMCGRKLDEE